LGVAARTRAEEHDSDRRELIPYSADHLAD